MNPLWNQEAVDGLFRNISGGFRPASALQLATFALLILAILLFYFFRHRRLKQGLRSRRKLFADRAFQAVLDEMKPTPTELDLLARFCEYADTEERGLLLKHRATFRRVNERFLADHPARVMETISLATRLGFKERPAGKSLRTTADIPAGSLLRSPEGAAHFQVSSIMPACILATRLDNHVGPGRELELHLHRPEGRYIFRTTILKVDEDRAFLQHAPRLERLQARDYYRYPLQITANLDGQSTRTRNLSGGGACLELTPTLEARLQEGGLYPLKLSIQDLSTPSTSQTVQSGVLEAIEAEVEVVAVLAAEDRIHLKFTEIREGDRDRLIRISREFNHPYLPDPSAESGANQPEQAPENALT